MVSLPQYVMSSAPFSGCVFERTPLLLAEVVVCDNFDPEGWEEWPYRPHTPDSRPHHKKNVLCLSKGEIFRAREMRCAVTRKRGLMMVINLSDQSVVSMLDVSAHMVLGCLCLSPMIKRDWLPSPTKQYNGFPRQRWKEWWWTWDKEVLRVEVV